MKLFKRLFSYLIAFTMVLSLATLFGGNVHAADNAQHVITINNAPTGRTYAAYQIFNGDYSNGTLSNIGWGNGVDSATLLSKLKDDTHNFNGITDKSSARDVAEKMSSEYDTVQAKAFAKYAAVSVNGDGFTSTESDGATKITVTGSGYYLVKDTTDSASQSNKNESYTRIIVKVVGENVNLTLKTDKPTVSKTVQDDDTDEKTASPAQDPATKYGKTADHSIGEEFNYKLVATIPNTNTSVNDYQGAYKLVFHDTMSKGLTYKGVTSVEVSDGDHTVGVPGYTVTKEDDTALENPTKASESGLTWKVTVPNLKAAKTGANALDLTKALTVTVIYKAELNEDAKIATPAHNKLHNDNEVQLEYSNNPNAEGEGTPTGKTSKDTAYVFTYELDNTKVDKADHNVKLDGAEFELKKDGKALNFTYDSTKNAYRYDPDTKADDATKLVSGHNQAKTGIFNIIGLDAGEYTLHETKAPDGYNTMADVTITIKAEHQLGTTPDVTLRFKKGNTEQNENAFTIENGKGSTLPSTGGMGTTLLYVAGGILVACAAAYVVLNKKRA